MMSGQVKLIAGLKTYHNSKGEDVRAAHPCSGGPGTSSPGFSGLHARTYLPKSTSQPVRRTVSSRSDIWTLLMFTVSSPASDIVGLDVYSTRQPQLLFYTTNGSLQPTVMGNVFLVHFTKPLQGTPQNFDLCSPRS